MFNKHQGNSKFKGKLTSGKLTSAPFTIYDTAGLGSAAFGRLLKDVIIANIWGAAQEDIYKQYYSN